MKTILLVKPIRDNKKPSLWSPLLNGLVKGLNPFLDNRIMFYKRVDILITNVSPNRHTIFFLLFQYKAFAAVFICPTVSIVVMGVRVSPHYSIRDMFRAGRYASIVVTIVILLFAHIYWPWLGISPLLRYLILYVQFNRFID